MEGDLQEENVMQKCCKSANRLCYTRNTFCRTQNRAPSIPMSVACCCTISRPMKVWLQSRSGPSVNDLLQDVTAKVSDQVCVYRCRMLHGVDLTLNVVEKVCLNIEVLFVSGNECTVNWPHPKENDVHSHIGCFSTLNTAL